MVPFQIKICGITSPNDAIAAMDCGADAIGLNFYPASPRFMSGFRAAEVVQALKNHQQASSNAKKPLVVGVFVNCPAHEVARLAQKCSLDAVQLHGDEQPDDILKIIQFVALEQDPALPELQFIRAIRCGGKSDSAQSSVDTFADTFNVQVSSESRRWIDAGVNAILLDSGAPTEYGGTGLKLDWDLVAGLRLSVPTILAGGLTPDNVAQAIKTSRTQSVDVSSGVEATPGVKSVEKIRQFVANTGWR